VSNAGTYGTPPRTFTLGQRISATLTRSAHIRRSKGSFTVAPGAVVMGDLEPVIGDASLGWDLQFDGDSIRVVLPVAGVGGPPVNIRAVAVLEFQEILFDDFSPSEVSGLALWLKPDAAWTNDTQLQTWTDSHSPGTINFTQDTAVNRPRTFTNVEAQLNGHPCVRFDQSGVNKQWLVQESGNLASFLPTPTADQYTIFVVARWRSEATGDPNDSRSNHMMLADTGGKVGFGFEGSATATDTTVSYNDDGSHLQSPARSPVAVGTTAADARTYTTWLSENYLWAQTAGGNGGLDRGVQASGTVSAPLTGSLRLGVNYNATKYTELDLWEVIFFNRALSIGERMNIIGYLSTQYNLSTN
jgi:hypothetical protein